MAKQFAKKIGVIRQQFDLIGQFAVIHNVLAGKLSDWGVLQIVIGLSTYPSRKRSGYIKHLERVGLADKIYEDNREAYQVGNSSV